MQTYYVREFAKLAGVTVRTLHYYDQAGLLKPTLHTRTRHRLYTEHDLLRLQQILTLKYLGFSLDEIHDLLTSSTYDIQKSLRLQKDAIDQRIQQLQQVSRALASVIRVVENDEAIDWLLVREIIYNVQVQAAGKQGWIRKYFSDEQLEQMQNVMQDETTLELAARGQLEWQAVFEAFREHRHLPPDHEDVQMVAARAQHLVDSFTQGNPEIIAALRRMSRTSRKSSVTTMTIYASSTTRP